MARAELFWEAERQHLQKGEQFSWQLHDVEPRGQSVAIEGQAEEVKPISNREIERATGREPETMTQEEAQLEGAAANGEAEKKKRTVKVVKRVKKRTDKGEDSLEPPSVSQSPSPSPLSPSPRPSLANVEPNSAQTADSKPNGLAPARTSSITNRSRPASSLESRRDENATPTSRPSLTTGTTNGALSTGASRRQRVQRSGSNVFAMFTQNQVAQFKEAFGFIDQDKDGIISRSDIRATFDALGRLCSDKELDEMTAEAPGPINFTMFLSVFGDRISGADDEEVVTKAFATFDEGDGFVREDK